MQSDADNTATRNQMLHSSTYAKQTNNDSADLEDTELDVYVCPSAKDYADWSLLESQRTQCTEEDDYDTCSEQAGQFERKPYLDRFSFVTRAEVHPISSTAYEVTGDAGLPFLHAKVRNIRSGCCGCGGSGNKGFTVDISDISSRQTVVKLICDQHGAVTVESPPREIIGYVSVERVLCSLRFTVRDIHGTSCLLVRMPKYCQASCKQHRFQILLPDESAKVASVERRVVQAAEADELGPIYTLLVSEMMSTDMKAILIGVMLMFDRKLFA